MYGEYFEILRFAFTGFVCAGCYKMGMIKINQYNYPDAVLEDCKGVSLSLEPAICNYLFNIRHEFNDDDFTKLTRHIDTIITLKQALQDKSIIPSHSDKIVSYGCYKVCTSMLQDTDNKYMAKILNTIQIMNAYIFDVCENYYT
jgi:hypothetical protein